MERGHFWYAIQKQLDFVNGKQMFVYLETALGSGALYMFFIIPSTHLHHIVTISECHSLILAHLITHVL